MALTAMLSQIASPLAYAGPKKQDDNSTTTPIKHVIVLIAENWSFDSVYGTYVPKHGTTANLLSKEIVTASGAPGVNSGLASQSSVNTPLPATYFISSSNKTEYSPLPTPELNGTPNVQKPLGSSAPFDSTVSDAELQILEPSLEVSDLGLLRTGASGAAGTTGLDTRITNATNLPNTSFQTLARPCLTIRTPAIRCIASITCGSSPIAASATRR
jgi:phospholipase C